MGWANGTYWGRRGAFIILKWISAGKRPLGDVGLDGTAM